MGERVYCIISDGANIYLPVKAKYSPYVDRRQAHHRNPVRRPSYLGQLPNFFGGKVEREDNGDTRKALCREVGQESQNKINLTNIDWKDMYLLIEQNVGDDTYYFWRVNVDAEKVTEFSGGNSKRLLNDAALTEGKYREMECILRIPITALTISSAYAEGEGADANIINKFLEECSKSYSGNDEEKSFFINILEESGRQASDAGKKLFNDWNGSETKAAFVNLVKNLSGLLYQTGLPTD